MMKQDTIQNMIDSMAISTEQGASAHNIWMWIAIVELAVIAILILLLCINPKNSRLDRRSSVKSKVLEEGNIDFDNTIQSAFHAEALYKELIVKCHPDRFATDEKKQAIASQLSASIGESKNNYNRLVELKKEAIVKLNIK